MNHDAIRRVYANAKTIDDGAGVFDADGNQIVIDQTLVDAAAVELQAEYQWKELRQERNRLIAETDYLALSDSTLTTEMATYRQALRDITNTYQSLDTVVWPTKQNKE